MLRPLLFPILRLLAVVPEVQQLLRLLPPAVGLPVATLNPVVVVVVEVRVVMGGPAIEGVGGAACEGVVVVVVVVVAVVVADGVKVWTIW